MSDEKRRDQRSAGAGARTGARASRRKLLGALGMLPALGAFASSSGGAAGEDVDAITQPTLLTTPEAKDYARLKRLDLGDPQVVARQKQMPAGRIGGLTVGRLISGSNLISMNMHARDLAYVRDLAAAYNTEERVFMTLKRCEELGVNTIVLKNHNFQRFKLPKYWTEWGGRMQWIADVITRDFNQYERLFVEHLDLGAAAAYLWGGATDTWYYEKKPEQIIRAYEIMRKYQVPVGIAAHRIEPIMFCQREGLVPDFYMLTLHHDRYWSAHPAENRRFMEMYEKESENHAEYHDNIFCHDAEKTVAFMREVQVPWIAFKILAAGAIPSENGFRYAFAGGADFVCVGMFDFQVEADARLAQKAVAAAGNRPRPWVG